MGHHDHGGNSSPRQCDALPYFLKIELRFCAPNAAPSFDVNRCITGEPVPQACISATLPSVPGSDAKTTATRDHAPTSPWMLSIPGLNTRETALVVWLVVLAVLLGRRRSVWDALWNVVTSLFQRYVIAAWLSALIYTGIVIAVLIHFRYWNLELLKGTIVWFFGSALVALFSTEPVGAHYYRQLILRNVAVVALVEFVVNLYTLPLPVELVLVFFMLFLPALQAVSTISPDLTGAKYDAVRRLISGCLSLLGVFLLLSSVIQIVLHWNETFSLEKGREFALPLVLSVAFVPILYFWKYFGTVQSMLVLVRFGIQGENSDLYRFARRRILGAIGFSVRRADLFSREFRHRLWGASTEDDVLHTIEAFRKSAKSETHGGSSTKRRVRTHRM
jgi:hypothetical protein